MTPDPPADASGTPVGGSPPAPGTAAPWPDPTSRWGFGDVALGIGLSQLLLLVAQVVVFALAGWDDLAEVPLWAVALLQVPLWAGWLVALFGAGAKGHGVVREFRVRFSPVDLPVGVAIGVLMQFAVLPLIYWPLLHLLGRSRDDLAEPARELADKAQGPAGWLVLGLVVVVGAPLVEELFYRGLLLGSLRKRGIPPALACLLCGAVFAAMHLQPLQFVGLLVLGTVLAGLVLRTGRIGGAVVAHATFNLVTVVVLATG